MRSIPSARLPLCALTLTFNICQVYGLTGPILRVDKMMSLRSTISEQMKAVASDQDKQLAPLSDDLVLLDSGLDSLGFAILVARLEDVLGFDPFIISSDAYYPVTFGDFVRFYEDAANSVKIAAIGTR